MVFFAFLMTFFAFFLAIFLILRLLVVVSDLPLKILQLDVSNGSPPFMDRLPTHGLHIQCRGLKQIQAAKTLAPLEETSLNIR